MTSAPPPPRQQRAERMLILRIVLALGLALLMVVGAWSASHGVAESHSSLCLAPGSAAASGSLDDPGDASAGGDAAAHSVLVVVAAICGIAAALLLLAGRRPVGAALLARARLSTAAPVRAGPMRPVPALTLTELSLSRT